MRFNRCKRYHFIMLAKTIFTEDITELNTKLIRVSFMYITTIYYAEVKLKLKNLKLGQLTISRIVNFQGPTIIPIVGKHTNVNATLFLLPKNHIKRNDLEIHETRNMSGRNRRFGASCAIIKVT